MSGTCVCMDVETWGAEKNAQIQMMLLCSASQPKEINFRIVATNDIALGWKEQSEVDGYLPFRCIGVDHHYVCKCYKVK